MEFGYYGEFNIAKHAIQQSVCADVIECGGINQDVTLEGFHFKVTTKSGRTIRLLFDASAMDVRKLCYEPIGLAIYDSSHDQVQLYSRGKVSELLRERGIEAGNLQQILCNIDQLEQVFKVSTGDSNAIRRTDQSRDYLQIEFSTEEQLDDYEYMNIREVDDYLEWPPR